MSPRFATNDLNKAAFLIAKGHELRAIEPSGKYSTFVFDSQAQPDADAYDRGATIPARIFAQTLRQLKAMVHQHR